jgi:hypothetical protein
LRYYFQTDPLVKFFIKYILEYREYQRTNSPCLSETQSRKQDQGEVHPGGK